MCKVDIRDNILKRDTFTDIVRRTDLSEATWGRKDKTDYRGGVAVVVVYIYIVTINAVITSGEYVVWSDRSAIRRNGGGIYVHARTLKAFLMCMPFDFLFTCIRLWGWHIFFTPSAQIHAIQWNLIQFIINNSDLCVYNQIHHNREIWWLNVDFLLILKFKPSESIWNVYHNIFSLRMKNDSIFEYMAGFPNSNSISLNSALLTIFYHKRFTSPRSTGKQ